MEDSPVKLVPEVQPTSQAPRKPFADPEFARAAGAKGIAAKQAKAEMANMDVLEYFAGYFEKEQQALVKDLMDAVKGRGPYVGLSPSDRLKALFRALEYTVGKPGATPAPKPPAPDPPLSIG